VSSPVSGLNAMVFSMPVKNLLDGSYASRPLCWWLHMEIGGEAENPCLPPGIHVPEITNSELLKKLKF